MPMPYFLVIISYIFLISMGINEDVYAGDILDTNSSVSVQFEDILGDSATTQIIRFRVKTCVLLNNHRRPRLEEQFQVSIENMETQEDKSFQLKVMGEDRCLTFLHRFSFELYKPEKLFFFNIEIKKTSNQSVISQMIAINPWDKGWTFSHNITNMSDYTKIRLARLGGRMPSPRFNYQISYKTIRFLYEHDDTSRPIKGIQKVLIYINPSSTTTRILRDGIYLMKASLLERDDLEEPKVGEEISTNRKLVRIINGQIITTAFFPHDDIRNMGTQSSAIRVQLEPVEEWRYQMVRLYNDFYNQRINALKMRNGSRITFTQEVRKDLSFERMQNIRNIIQLMSQNKERIHQFMIHKHEREKESRKIYLVNDGIGIIASFLSREVSSCYGLSEVYWSEIFEEFNLTHSTLADLGEFDFFVKDQPSIFLSDDLSKEKGEVRGGNGCYVPYNVVAPLLLNDVLNVSLEPILGISLDAFVESPESSGIGKEELIFFGSKL